MGSRPTREGEVGPVRYPDGGQRGVAAAVRLSGDQRRLGRCVEVVVAASSGRPRARYTAGNLPGQRAEELRPADPVLEADGGVRRLVGAGAPVGGLSAVPPQVQPDRTLLVGAGEEVERGIAEQPGGGPAMRPSDDLEGIASDGETLRGHVSRRGTRRGPGDEAVRGTTATLGDPAEV